MPLPIALDCLGSAGVGARGSPLPKRHSVLLSPHCYFAPAAQRRYHQSPTRDESSDPC